MPVTTNDQEEQRQWFAIRTKPHQENLAQLNYQRQGYEVYLPLVRKTIRHARRTQNVLRPFFPGYLFLHLAPGERNWHAIASTRGVLTPVRFGDQFVSVPSWVIDGIREKETSPGILSPTQFLAGQLAVGSEVAISLADGRATTATIFSLDGTRNVVVLLDLLQRKIKATVAVDSLMA